MKRTVIVTLLSVLALAATVVTAQETIPRQEYLAYYVDIRVLAPERSVVSVAIAQWADANGGYYTTRSDDRVVIRLPRERIPELRSALTDAGGRILSLAPSTSDQRQELLAARAAISSRQEALDRILALMSTADIGATLDFERELRSINQEIEYFRGRERQILNDSRFARVVVSLTSEASNIPDYLPSVFPWINGIDLYDFLEEQP